MNREALRKHWKVIEAFKNGKAVEFRVDDLGEWEEVAKPSFNSNYQYRVKISIGDKVRSLTNKSTTRTILGECTIGKTEYWVVSKNTNPNLPAYMMSKNGLILHCDSNSDYKYELV